MCHDATSRKSFVDLRQAFYWDGQRLLRIGLVFGYGLAYYRDILRGIRQFAEQKPDWIFTPLSPDNQSIQTLSSLKFDGLIAHVYSVELAEALIALRKPVVNVSGVLPEQPIYRVSVDHVLVGRMAADHLLDRGFRQFGYVGYPDRDFSLGRERGFREQLELANCEVVTFYEKDQSHPDPTGLWSWNTLLPDWLKSLRKPVAIFTSQDIQGVKVSEACRSAGLRVPDDVAILGVDDDDLLCEMTRPSMSSVALPSQRIGYEAASLLSRLMSGKRPSSRTMLLPPREVVVRQSTDVLCIEDQIVAAAIRYIRDHVHLPIRVSNVLKVIPVSRRSLERRFLATLGRGISQEIRRVHVDRAKSLLAGTELPMSQVARLSGFTEGRQLSVVFRQETGLTPTAYRRDHNG